MNLLSRLKNAYETNGIKEVFRKAFFHALYRVNNQVTKAKVMRRALENGLNDKPRDKKIIISLTSFPERFANIDLCLKSLLLQKVKADRIIVYLGSDTRESDITPQMRELEKYGIEYRIDNSNNLLAHKKYYYAMKEFPDDLIVTADDDLIYPLDWLETLYNSYLNHPDAISARRVHKIVVTQEGEVAQYNHWIDQCRSIKNPSCALIGTGGSGKLYPPHLLSEKLFDKEIFMDICSHADDIWLKCIEALSKVKVVWAKNDEVDLMSTNHNPSIKLSTVNVNNNGNDSQLKAVMDFLELSADVFID